MTASRSSRMPLTDIAWSLIVAAAGGVRGKAFWMSHPTWAALTRERPRKPGQLYSVRVMFDDAMSFGVIRLERRTKSAYPGEGAVFNHLVLIVDKLYPPDTGEDSPAPVVDLCNAPSTGGAMRCILPNSHASDGVIVLHQGRTRNGHVRRWKEVR